ncbi:MAG: hypothetical protein R3A78_10740 [Polyangiales bacterium]
MGGRVSTGDAEALARIVARAERCGEVGLVVLELLARQGEAQTLFAGSELVDSALKRHDLDRDAGATELGNVFAILTEGPSNASERGLVISFAWRGIRRALERDKGDADEQLLAFVRHADWFEFATDYSVYAYAAASVGAENTGRVWTTVGNTVLDDARGEPTAAGRARCMVRLDALATSEHAAATEALVRIAKEVADSAVRAAARALAGGSLPGGAAVEGSDIVPLEGRAVRAPAGTLRAWVRCLSGWATLVWLVRAVAWLVGWRESTRITVVETRVHIERSQAFFGRVVREREAWVPLYALTRVERHSRFPLIYSLVGIASLAAGVLVGGTLLVEGLRAGVGALVLGGATVALAGALLDLGLDVLAPARRNRVAVELRAHPKLALCVRADDATARKFVDGLAPRISGAVRTAGSP